MYEMLKIMSDFIINLIEVKIPCVTHLPPKVHCMWKIIAEIKEQQIPVPDISLEHTNSKTPKITG